MIIHKSGTAEIRHANTGKVYFIDSDEIDFEVTGVDDRQMGSETFYSAVVEHPELGELRWLLVEYPVGAENFSETNVGQHKLLQNIEYSLEHESEEDDETNEEKAERVEELVGWFHSKYEDPAYRLPYESREGGYQWIYGGPYDAREELQKQFPDEKGDVIDTAVAEIEAEGLLDWAPVPSPEDYDDNLYEELSAFTTLKETGEELKNLIEQLPVSEPSFAIGSDNLLHMTFGSMQPVSINSELLNELCSLATELSENLDGTNAYTVLREALTHYRDGLYINPASISLIYARGIGFENAAQTTYADISTEELPDLSATLKQKLKSILDVHAAFIMAHEEGRSLVNGAYSYRQTADQAQQFQEAASRIAVDIKQNPTIFGADVREHISVVTQDIGKGEYPERSNQVAAIAQQGVSTALLKGIGWIALAALSQTAPIGALSGFMNIGFDFLLSHIADLKVIVVSTGGEWSIYERIFDAVKRIKIYLGL